MKYEKIVKNLEQIKTLCEEDAPIMASHRIQWLIDDIKKHQYNLTFWDILTGKKS
jgi:cell fate (sporulation/competence/biofilm development) regulator YmcA (YheA/YmcA/DUF963 family)